MHYTALISMVKTSTPGCGHFVFKFTQISVLLDFLKAVPENNGTLKYTKNQCFMNNQLLCGKCQPIYAEATGCITTLG